MFVLNSDITIGNFRFSGVHEVHIKRSIHSLADSAVIKLPSISRILADNKTDQGDTTTGQLFNTGDEVVIKLGYNGELETEFKGFVAKISLGMPLEVVCEGYSWLLRKNKAKAITKPASVKDLLTAAIANLPPDKKIEIICEADLQLSDISNGKQSGYDVITNIIKSTDDVLTCFFISPGVLWCGLVYTPYAHGDEVLGKGSVSYRLGYNTLKENTLKERSEHDDPVQVHYSKKEAGGAQLQQSSDAFKQIGRTYQKVLNKIKQSPALKKIANEKAYKLNYTGYEGTVTAFLQPFAAPGYTAHISDSRYPALDGAFVIESTEVIFGTQGARRIIEAGPRIGFAKK